MNNSCIYTKFQLSFPSPKYGSFNMDIDLDIPGQGVTAIFGHSGSGKTTFLRCMAGLQPIKQAQIIVNGDIWQDENGLLATHKRPLGYVFQEASLFDHLTAEGNLLYAVKRSTPTTSGSNYHNTISLMGLESILDKYPRQLSGGERQRVAIARALLINPKLLLMDEPLASLDEGRKQEILPYLEQLRTELKIPILFVSHSIDEVARLADHLVILEKGKVIANGKMTELLSKIDLPVHFGEDTGVLIEGTVVERDSKWHLVRVEFTGGELWLKDNGDAINEAVRIRILARDVSLSLTKQEDTSILNRLSAEVLEILPASNKALSLVRLKIGSTIIIARVTNRSVENLGLQIESKVWAQIKSVAIVR